jgi:CheY-like chemotaxis protein
LLGLVSNSKICLMNTENKRVVQLFLVDDDEEDVDMFEAIFREEGTPCKLTVATDPVGALDKLISLERKDYPDLIILDLSMPKIGGLEFLAKLKHDEFLQQIPVVFLSDSDCPSTVEKAYDSYASGYIRKPCSLEECRQTARCLKKWWGETILLPRED